VLPILTSHARDLTAGLARSARPAAPVRPEPAAAPAPRRRSPGPARRAAAAALRRSADRLAPMIE